MGRVALSARAAKRQSGYDELGPVFMEGLAAGHDEVR
jgi:hypothetical protein